MKKNVKKVLLTRDFYNVKSELSFITSKNLSNILNNENPDVHVTKGKIIPKLVIFEIYWIGGHIFHYRFELILSQSKDHKLFDNYEVNFQTKFRL